MILSSRTLSRVQTELITVHKDTITLLHLTILTLYRPTDLSIQDCDPACQITLP